MKPLDFKTQASRLVAMRKMAANGYGWEDICYQWNITDPEEQVRIRHVVLHGRKTGELRHGT